MRITRTKPRRSPSGLPLAPLALSRTPSRHRSELPGVRRIVLLGSLDIFWQGFGRLWASLEAAGGFWIDVLHTIGLPLDRFGCRFGCKWEFSGDSLKFKKVIDPSESDGSDTHLKLSPLPATPHAPPAPRPAQKGRPYAGRPPVLQRLELPRSRRDRLPPPPAV